MMKQMELEMGVLVLQVDKNLKAYLYEYMLFFNKSMPVEKFHFYI